MLLLLKVGFLLLLLLLQLKDSLDSLHLSLVVFFFLGGGQGRGNVKFRWLDLSDGPLMLEAALINEVLKGQFLIVLSLRKSLIERLNFFI